MKTIQDVKDYITANYDPEDTLGCWWDTGNYDDSYEMGNKHGRAQLLSELGRRLGMELKDLEYSNFDQLFREIT